MNWINQICFTETGCEYQRLSSISNEANVNLDEIPQCPQFKSLAQYITNKLIKNDDQKAKGKHVHD